MAKIELISEKDLTQNLKQIWLNQEPSFTVMTEHPELVVRHINKIVNDHLEKGNPDNYFPIRNKDVEAVMYSVNDFVCHQKLYSGNPDDMMLEVSSNHQKLFILDHIITMLKDAGYQTWAGKVFYNECSEPIIDPEAVVGAFGVQKVVRFEEPASSN